MSYNIDSVNCKVLCAYMSAVDIIEFAKDEDNLCEGNFIHEHLNDARKVLAEYEKNGKMGNLDVKLNNLWWYGVGSGNRYQFLVKTIAPKIKGDVEAIFTWEGGDGFTGLVVRNGVIKEGQVEQRVII